MARLYADEDFPLGAIQMLRNWGHEVLTVQEAGRSGTADADMLADATGDQRAVLTHNHRDFKRLHALTQSHAGTAHSRRHYGPPQLGEPVHPHRPP